MRLLRLKRFWLILLLPASMGLVSLASAHPQTTEALYSTGVYPLLTGSLGWLFSRLPFSLAQYVVIAAPLLLLLYIVLALRGAVKHKAQRRDRVAKLAANLLMLMGVGYFLFIALCGLNYHRESFAALSGLEVRPSSTEELAALCGELVQRANALRDQVAEDEDGTMALSLYRWSDLTALSQDAYESLSASYPILGGATARAKPVVFSRAMSMVDITGVYMPFTFEANVNVDIPQYWIPSTMMHELAHSKGFMREDEANFISFLACEASGDADFAYSGTMLALIYSTNALYSADKELYWPVMDSLSDGVKADLAANNAYWNQFEGPVSDVGSAVNDVYLKTNRQTGGVKSYGRMVDLLLAEYRRYHAEG